MLFHFVPFPYRIIRFLDEYKMKRRKRESSRRLATSRRKSVDDNPDVIQPRNSTQIINSPQPQQSQRNLQSSERQISTPIGGSENNAVAPVDPVIDANVVASSQRIRPIPPSEQNHQQQPKRQQTPQQQQQHHSQQPEQDHQQQLPLQHQTQQPEQIQQLSQQSEQQQQQQQQQQRRRRRRQSDVTKQVVKATKRELLMKD